MVYGSITETPGSHGTSEKDKHLGGGNVKSAILIYLRPFFFFGERLLNSFEITVFVCFVCFLRHGKVSEESAILNL